MTLTLSALSPGSTQLAFPQDTCGVSSGAKVAAKVVAGFPCPVVSGAEKVTVTGEADAAFG